MQKSVGNLSLIEKVGQMFIIGLDSTEATGDIIELIQTYKIGGVLLKKNNLVNVTQTQKLINDLKGANKGNSVPLFIAISEEPGRGNSLPKDIRLLPSIRYIVDNCEKETIYDTQYIIANLLRKLGINMNFAPLLDMGGIVEGIPLGDRCVSNNNTSITSFYGSQTVKAHAENGIISVPKYFPGHASAKTDRSNIIIPHTNKSISKLEQLDLIPFKNMIDEGIESMMIGNINLSKLNLFAPATVSHRVVAKLLKGRLNFGGISITDDLCSTCMMVQYGIKSSTRKALAAGNDIVVLSDVSKAKSVLEDIERLVVNGWLDSQDIESRVQKILNLKEKYNLTDEEMPPIDVQQENQIIDNTIERIRRI